MIGTISWATVSALATAGGTLVLALATFASVRSANRAARTAERAFQVGLRPVLFQSDLQDIARKIRWGDDHWVNLRGGTAVVEEVDGSIYMALSIRNMGSGIAVIHSWHVDEIPDFGNNGNAMTRPDLDDFRLQNIDLYAPSGHVSYWQAAIRDESDALWKQLHDTVENRRGLLIDLLYTDHEGHQRTISRFRISPRAEEHTDWLCNVIRHWNLDRPDPRG